MEWRYRHNQSKYGSGTGSRSGKRERGSKKRKKRGNKGWNDVSE